MRIPSRRSIPVAIALAIRMVVVLGLAVWALSPGPALAEASPAAAPSGDAASIPCLCRFAGTNYQQAECACLPTSDGPRLACCGKVLNNSSWMFMGASCSLSQNRPDGGEAAPQIARRARETR